MSLSFPTIRDLGLVSSGLFLGVLALSQACSSPDDGTAATGGTPSTGGTATSTGGTPAATGGTASGGNATGGTATGGSSTGGTATGGNATGGAATGGSATAGATSTGGQSSNTGGVGGASAGSSGNGGAAGASAGAGGAAGKGGAGGGTGGATGGTGGASGKGGAGGSAGGPGGGAGGASNTGGAAGAGGAGKTAVAMLMPTTGNQLTGTGTFTQTGQSVTLVIQVSNCPAGGHASHIHLNKSCGNNGDDAGGHWVPQGEVIPEITCASDGTGTATVTPTAGTWTIGSGTTDVTTHALMVHVGNNANPGGRVACGVINAQ